MEKWVPLVMLLFLYLTLLMEAEVTYDGRSLVIDGHRKILFSGSIHYPRSTPQSYIGSTSSMDEKELVAPMHKFPMKSYFWSKTFNGSRGCHPRLSKNNTILMWPNLIEKAKEGGVDVIQTYVFWNLHEPQPGQYDFSGRYDLVSFIKEIQAQGLYVCLRIGPYIESEWTYGGFPFWLHDVTGIVYRTDNEPFKYYMQNFTTKIVNMMKSEGLYAAQGGPIILSQIENEYQNIQKSFGEEGSRYVEWAAEMAVGLHTGVPWVMCKQTDAPDPLINTCNGMKCGETFTGPNSPNKPSLWTENWTSFYQVYGGVPYIRSAEDIAFHVTLFIARKNGSYVNYYMYHGGTNFGRSSSAYVITSYYDQAPLDEYGLLRQPKWGHLKELHAAIKSCSTTLLQGIQTNFSLGKMQEGYVFEDGDEECVAFLVNNDSVNKVTVQFQSRSYELLPKSISILPDCQNVTFNTANVNTKSNKRVINPVQSFSSTDKWEQFQDVIPKFEDTLLISNQLLEHMNLTKDKSDYLWYTLRFEHNSPCTESTLHVQSAAHVAHAFVDDTYIGGAHGSHDVKSFTLEVPITLNEGTNNISILSVMVGLPDSGAFLERRFAGLTSVEIQCSEESYDLTNSTWGYQVGLLGEQLQIYEEQNNSPVEWSQIGNTINQRLTWYKSVFDSPEGDDPVALNLGSMGKGETWVNGQSIGRYWILFHDSNGQPSQALYHVPRSFLKDTGNVLVVFEEGGGDPLHISINTVSTTYLDDTISK